MIISKLIELLVQKVLLFVSFLLWPLDRAFLVLILGIILYSLHSQRLVEIQIKLPEISFGGVVLTRGEINACDRFHVLDLHELLVGSLGHLLVESEAQHALLFQLIFTFIVNRTL